MHSLPHSACPGLELYLPVYHLVSFSILAKTHVTPPQRQQPITLTRGHVPVSQCELRRRTKLEAHDQRRHLSGVIEPLSHSDSSPARRSHRAPITLHVVVIVATTAHC